MNNPVYRYLLVLVIFFSFFSCDKSDLEVPVSLTVSQSEFNIDESPHTLTIQVTSNSSWKVSENSDWISFSVIEGQGDLVLVLMISENIEEEARESTFMISNSSISHPILIKQAGAEPENPCYFIEPDVSGMRDISSLALSSEMGTGWNLGNTLEAIGGETAWGNPIASKLLIDKVKEAGFNSVRIPVAWSKFTNPSDYTIDPVWMARVQEVVDYVIENDMYAVLNIHWDEGWMQPTYEQQDYVNDRLEKMWIQIGLNFRDYDDNLVFAGTNEIHVKDYYGTPSTENLNVQNTFNQTFVSAVRSTGGRNTYRNLVVQSYNTNIDLAISYFILPEDDTEDRLMLEVHYYDPYEFALQESKVSEWGKDADPAKSVSWGNEAYAIGQFEKLKTKFINVGIPVLVGEFGAISKLDYPEHASFREYYVSFISQEMKKNKLVPFYWDNGYAGNHGFGIINRENNEIVYPELIEGMIK